MLKKLPESKMYNFFIDDNVFFFADIVRHSFKSIFDNFYLAGLKSMHEKYGVKFTLNSFYHNFHEPEFDLSLVDDRYKSEFEDNCDWLKFAFHGESEFPEYPYSEAYPEKYPEHYAKWLAAIKRIAGEQSVIAPVIYHYFGATPEIRRFMRERGMKFHTLQQQTDLHYNAEFDQYEMSADAILNLFRDDIDGIRKILEGKIASGQTKILIGSHEQYAYRHYENYIPQYFDEIEVACKTMQENGFESVYFNELI